MTKHRNTNNCVLTTTTWIKLVTPGLMESKLQFSELPLEIWHQIADEFTPGQLASMRHINMFFFHRWLAYRYRTCDIGVQDTDDSFNKLKNLMDPLLASNLSVLLIGIHLEQLKASEVTVDSVFTRLFQTIPLLTNLTFLRLECTKIHPYQLASLFHVLCSSRAAGTLETLCLLGSVDLYVPFFDGGYCNHRSPFRNLKNLEMTMIDRRIRDYLHNTHTADSYSAGLAAPLISFLGPSLQQLKIESDLDIATLFDDLTLLDVPVAFPKLHTFSLYIINSAISVQSPPHSLRRFLHDCKLKHLSLRYAAPYIRNAADPAEAWLTAFADSDSPFPPIATLRVDSSCKFSIIQRLVMRTGATLRSLTLSTHSLRDPEVKNLLRAITEGAQIQTGTETRRQRSKLERLNLNVFKFPVTLLDYLARRFPRLRDLSLNTIEVIGSDYASFYDVLHHRRYDPATPTGDILHSWKLSYLYVRRCGDEDLRAVRAVAGAVPSLARSMEL